MVGRQWSDGLHQAVEAKERVKIKEENQTLATITLQNFFKLYRKLSGMTGTAMTEANEFWKVYGLDVVAVPTNKGMKRVNHADVIYLREEAKYKAAIEEIREVHATGRPILVGTTSIERSEYLGEMLERYGITHQVLNAKHHEREAEIVAQAGRKGMVTIATNMAGRGTDIILGGNPEFMAWADLKHLVDAEGRLLYPTRLEVPPEVWREAVDKYEPQMRAEGREVAELGGLHIIGTERHESRRIDNQLRGRSGRQGDTGSSRFFLALEDDLMRKFAGNRVTSMLQWAGMGEDEAIESKMVSRQIEGAQKKVEERNFDIRKNLLEYDEVMDEQRKRVYSFRQQLLEGLPTKDAIMRMVDTQLNLAVDEYLADDYPASTFAAEAGSRLGIELRPKSFKGQTFDNAQAIARKEAEDQIADVVAENIEENLPRDAEPAEWNWVALTNWFNSRLGQNLKDRDLKKFLSGTGENQQLDRRGLQDFLVERAHESIQSVDMAPLAGFLKEDWGRQSLAGWVYGKFGLTVDPDQWAGLSKAQIVSNLQTGVRALYTLKEAEFPVQVAMHRFLGGGPTQKNQVPDFDGLAQWFSARYGVPVEAAELRTKSPADLETSLKELAGQHYEGAKLWAALDSRLDQAFGPEPVAVVAVREARNRSVQAPDSAGLKALSTWAQEELGLELDADTLRQLGRQEARKRLAEALDNQCRPEMREMEKVVLLDKLDSGWMEHLRTMDHLRSSVGLRGYAQVDPKVEYKREGMKIFEEMWSGLGDKVTDLVFRMEQLDPDFVNYHLGSRWQLSRARMIHESPVSASETGAPAPVGTARAQQEAATSNHSQAGEKKAEPVRHTGQKLGRNDPCPCGSGRKYKVCCMGKTASSDIF